MFASDTMGLSVFVFTQLFSKGKERSSRQAGAKAEFNVKQPFKVIQDNSRSCVLKSVEN